MGGKGGEEKKNEREKGGGTLAENALISSRRTIAGNTGKRGQYVGRFGNNDSG